jgi:hypothetical protein
LIIWCLQQFTIQYEPGKGKYLIRLHRDEVVLETGLSLHDFTALIGVPIITETPYPWDIEKVGHDLYR